MMEKESNAIESEIAGDCYSNHSSSRLKETTSAKTIPTVISSINSTNERPPRSRSSSMGGKTMEGESTSCEKTLQVQSYPQQQLDTQLPLRLEVETKNSSRQIAEERPMTTASEDGDSTRSVKSSTPSESPIVEQGLESTNAAFEDFITSPKGQHAIVERSPGGRYVRFLEKLGSGASKDVYRAYDTTEGIEVAWNVIQLSGVPKNERNRIVNEVRLLERLHHANIISFHGSWVNRERQEVNFVTEILSSGTLTSFIEKVQVIRWKIAKRWATQILKGLEYLHSQDPPVIHRDLKCENIFINGTSGDLRIGDLGLSTVHRNGKVLSVLGTPEFMAPDLYEDSAYDEKVDIYAFGMCLLEILTKEYPYRECSNPAQIYKKVINGSRPDSLNRLRSEMARKFITLCLGFKDEVSGKYVRPSASELLNHQFLNKSKDDDSEVIVDPPLQRETIVEITLHQSTKEENSSERLIPRPLSRRNTDATADDGSDKFEEMPDSEVNIKKVKVFMGRNEELKEEEDESISEKEVVVKTQNRHNDFSHTQLAPSSLSPLLSSANETQARAETNFQNTALQPPSIQQTDLVDRVIDTPSQALPPNELSLLPMMASSQQTHHQLQAGQHVAGALHGNINIQAAGKNLQFIFPSKVVEDVSAALPHYQDNILKLIITLPVDGQTHNVQFDFDLVQDDPVEVAREMQRELGIPEEAILEISGTISSLAREARIKQGEHRQQQVTQNVNTVPAGVKIEKSNTTQLFHTQKPPLQQQQAQNALHGRTTLLHENHAMNQTFQQQNSKQTHNTRNSIPKQVSSITAPPGSQTNLLHHSGQSIIHTTVSPKSHPTKISNSNLLAQTKNTAAHTFPAGSQKAVPKARPPPNMTDISDRISKEKNMDNAENDTTDADDLDDDVESINFELGKLQEDFRRDMMRAKKVYDNRMDNLTRSKKEKEEQHIKTLEKHEKEKMQFEKRVKQEAMEQSQRLEKIQRKYESERQKLVRKKQGSGQLSSTPPQDSFMKPSCNEE